MSNSPEPSGLGNNYAGHFCKSHTKSPNPQPAYSQEPVLGVARHSRVSMFKCRILKAQNILRIVGQGGGEGEQSCPV